MVVSGVEVSLVQVYYIMIKVMVGMIEVSVIDRYDTIIGPVNMI